MREAAYIDLGCSSRGARCVRLAAQLVHDGCFSWLLIFPLPECVCGCKRLSGGWRPTWRRQNRRVLGQGWVRCPRDLVTWKEFKNKWVIIFPQIYICDTVTMPVAHGLPLSYPAGCVLRAAGTHSSCTPPSAPSSLWPGHSLPFWLRISSPHYISPNALRPGSAEDRER